MSQIPEDDRIEAAGDTVPRAPTVPRRTWLALSVAGVSILLFVLDSGLLAVSFPAIEREFPATPRSVLSWAATGFLVAQASLLLLSGRIADRAGRKLVYLGGVILFTTGALATSLAPTPSWLIGARVLQGAGAAFLTSSALALVLPLFPLSRRSAAIGVWGSIGSVGAVLAPTIGALVVLNQSWRWTFAGMVPIGILTVLVGRRVLDEPVTTRRPVAVDVVSVATGSFGLGCMATGLSQGRRWGWGSPLTVCVGAAAAGLLAIFVIRSRREVDPLFEVSLFRYRQWTANTIAAGFQQVGFFAWFLTTPLILVNLWGWTVLRAGGALAVGQVVAGMSGLFGGRWADRRGSTVPICAGAVVSAIGLLWLVFAASAQPDFWGVFLPACVIMGAGFGICGILTTGGALHGLPEHVLGAANSAHQLLRRIAGLIGVVLALAIVGDQTGPAILDAARQVWLMVAAAHLAMCVPLLLTARAGSDRRRVRVDRAEQVPATS